MGIPRGLRDFQAKRESRFLDFSALRLFHSPLRADFSFLQRPSFHTVVPQTLGPVSNGECSVQVLMHGDRAARQGGAPAHRLNLEAQILYAHRVIAIHGTLILQRKNQIQVFAATAHKGAPTLGRRNLEAPLNSAM